MSPRIQRLRMKLLRFSFTAEHVPGNLITDAEIAENDLNIYVNLIIKSMPATESRLNEIRKKTGEDELLKQLEESIISGWPNKKNTVQLISSLIGISNIK